MSAISKEVVRIGRESKFRKNGYQCFMLFTLHCLDLVSEHFSPTAMEWRAIAEQCKDGGLTEDEVTKVAKEIIEYSVSLGEHSEHSIHTINGVIAYLFSFVICHENSKWRPDIEDVVMALECFIDKFLEFFEKEEAVLDLLKKDYPVLTQ